MLEQLILGKLTWDSIPWHTPIVMGAGALMAFAAIAIVGSVIYFGKVRYLWDE